jgi:hypothetical protein
MRRPVPQPILPKTPSKRRLPYSSWIPALAPDSTEYLDDLQIILNEAQSRYEQQHEGKKVAKWLSQFSSRICHYGQILDVLVQHHPEYVSLAWGAMKFLFIVRIASEHGRITD